MATTLCFDFLSYPLNHVFNHGFSQAGWSFAFVGGINPVVHADGGQIGLRFADAGIKIGLPVQTTRLSMVIGRFATDVKVIILDAAGHVIGTGIVTAPNQYTTLNFRPRQRAASVVLSGGNNEAVLAKICITF